MNIHPMPIRSGSRRRLLSAMRKAGITFTTKPHTHERDLETSDILLRLLVLGVDHLVVGSGPWYWAILAAAPENAVPQETE